jgi:RNA polymerase sigma factor (sigma-70 family)
MMAGSIMSAIPRASENVSSHREDGASTDLAALSELYRNHGPRLLRRFARRADWQEAGDLVQETFVRLVHAEVKLVDGIEKPEAYLNRIASNLLVDRAKVARRRSLANHVSADDVPLAGEDLTARLEARDQLHRLQDALMRLGPKTRAIFLAHRLDGISYKDIATRSGLSIKGVERHMGKAIAHLGRMQRRC